MRPHSRTGSGEGAEVVYPEITTAIACCPPLDRTLRSAESDLPAMCVSDRRAPGGRTRRAGCHCSQSIDSGHVAAFLSHRVTTAQAANEVKIAREGCRCVGSTAAGCTKIIHQEEEYPGRRSELSLFDLGERMNVSLAQLPSKPLWIDWFPSST